MSSQMPVTLCARQPIFDRHLDVFAYELLFRQGDDNCANVSDGDAASAKVILNSFTESPYENVLEGKKGFINFTRPLLRDTPPVSGDQIVIEVLEGIDVDDSVVSDVKNLKKSGYTIALDDYVYDEGHHKLLELADIIKIDVLGKSESTIGDELRVLKDYHVDFLAEKIETKEVFEQCQQMGFSFFQGFFLSKPNVIKGKRIAGDEQGVMRFLQVLQDRKSGFGELEMAVASSPSLTFKLLSLINSSAFSFSRSIDSIKQALTLLGLAKIRTWGSMLALSELSSKPKVLCAHALIRAQMCKLLAESVSKSNELDGDSLFTAGLLSLMDAFLDMKMEAIVKSLGLSTWLAETIIERKGNMGLLLDTAILYETAEFGRINWHGLRRLGFQPDDIQNAYYESAQWAGDIMKQMH